MCSTLPVVPCTINRPIVSFQESFCFFIHIFAMVLLVSSLACFVASLFVPDTMTIHLLSSVHSRLFVLVSLFQSDHKICVSLVFSLV